VASVEEAMGKALEQAKISRSDIERIVTTGAGRKAIPFAQGEVTDVMAAARGAVRVIPSARTVIDVGAEEGRGIKCDARGKVIDFAVNERCAAGAGAFTEAMARALEISLDDLARMALETEEAAPINAQCVIFAESEVVSQIHAKIPKPNICRAIHDGIASRISAMTRRVGIEKDVALIGGVSHNVGFVDSLNKTLGVEVIIPENPEFIGALGAAITAQG
jgi:benzoyl-CoA reductase subunit D